MAKIPVGTTILQAYRFAIGGFPQVLAVIWLPWLILALAGGLLARQSMALFLALAAHDATTLARVLPVLVPFYAATVILTFMQVAGLTELALGLRRESRKSALFYFSFAKPLWRLIGAFALLALAAVLCWFVCGYALLLLAHGIRALVAHGRLNPGLGGGSLLAILIVVWCAYLYALARLSFFLTPVVMAEGAMDFRRSWALGRGNVWRILTVVLAVLLPVAIIKAVLVLGFLAHSLPPLPPPHATAQQLTVARLGMAAWNGMVMARANAYWYLVYPVSMAITALLYGAGWGAQCFAYRALTGAKPNPP